MSEVHVWESSQIWRREDGAIVEDRQGKHYSSDPNEAFIHVVLLADYTALRETVKRLNRRCQEAETAMVEYRKLVAAPPDGVGIRFVSGSLGRALLAWHCDHLRWLIDHGERHFGTLWRQATPADVAAIRSADPTTGSR